jgi:hypothetical protein
MKTLKVMSIIGMVLSAFSFMFMSWFNNAVDYEAAIGWGVIMVLWTIAFSVVVLVQSNKYKN